MKKIFSIFLILAICCSHTMFLKFDSYFLEPNTPATLQLFNGTFEKSENVIDRNRMIDASIISNGIRYQAAESQWSEKDSTTYLTIQTGEAGTYVAGISTKARSLEMEAKAFNDYLTHEGLFDMLEWREKNNALDSSANEKYSKHVKTIFQVGDTRTNDWQTALGYPIEFVPLKNPYNLHTGDSLAVRLLVNGKPLPNQLVYADFRATEANHSHSHGHTEEAHDHSNDHHTDDGHHHDHEDQHSHSHEKGHSHDKNEAHDHSHDHHTDDEHHHDHEESHGHSYEKEHSHNDNEAHNHGHEHENSQDHSHDDHEPHAHEREKNNQDHSHATGQKLRTDANGVVKAHLHSDGIWYFQTINLVHSSEENLTHESNWTTLTFQVTHAHGSDTHTHDSESDYNTYLFLLGSIVLVGGLFFWFNKKNKVNAN